MNRETCILDDGQRISFSLKRRERDPFYLVLFRGPDEKPKERSTKEANKKRATDSAIVIIKSEYSPKVMIKNPSWDESVEVMVEHMKARNLRPASITDYEVAVRNLRKIFPNAFGPTSITPAMAEKFKIERLKAGKSPYTVRGNLVSLGVIYGNWWVKVGKIIEENPFSDVAPPKVEQKPVRIIAPEELGEFFDWFSARWKGWKLPVLFLEVKALVGCRIMELASSVSEGLTEGRILFAAETTKGRKQRVVKLPQETFCELKKLAGKTFVFERFSDQLRKIHTKRGNPHHANSVRDFSPIRLRYWIEDQAEAYFTQNPDAAKFKLHNLRGTAMSKARMAGVSHDDASVAFGCHPETMRRHYILLDEAAITDRVMDEIQGRNKETPRFEKREDDNGRKNTGEKLGR